ncbi:hypothetical protein D3C85_1659730 [compost metagenome]
MSGSYWVRLHGLLYAFWHIGRAFMRAETLVLEHYVKELTPEQRKISQRRSKALFWRQLRYVAPRMLKILLPNYDPARIPVPRRVQAALDFFRSQAPIRKRVELALDAK